MYGSISRFGIDVHRSTLFCIDMAGLFQHGPDQDNVTKKFQVPKMEGFLNLRRLFLGVGFPLHRRYIQPI